MGLVPCFRAPGCCPGCPVVVAFVFRPHARVDSSGQVLPGPGIGYVVWTQGQLRRVWCFTRLIPTGFFPPLVLFLLQRACSAGDGSNKLNKSHSRGGWPTQTPILKL